MRNLIRDFSFLTLIFAMLSGGYGCGRKQKEPAPTPPETFSFDQLKTKLEVLEKWTDDNQKNLDKSWGDKKKDLKLDGIAFYDLKWTNEEVNVFLSKEQIKIIDQLYYPKGDEDKKRLIEELVTTLKSNDFKKMHSFFKNRLYSLLSYLNGEIAFDHLLALLGDQSTPLVEKYQILSLLSNKKSYSSSVWEKKSPQLQDSIVTLLLSAENGERGKLSQLKWIENLEKEFLTHPLSFTEKAIITLLVKKEWEGSAVLPSQINEGWVTLFEKWWNTNRTLTTFHPAWWSELLDQKLDQEKSLRCRLLMIALKVIEKNGDHTYIPVIESHQNDCGPDFLQRSKSAVAYLDNL